MRSECAKTFLQASAALALALCLSACGYLDGKDLKKERSSRDYHTAMADYRAGRLPQAIEGLRSVCRSDPANASARFQLACLLQDSAQDYFGAACAYREYLQQCSNSDKSCMANDRLSVCERELARVLASRYGLNDVATQTAQVDALRLELKNAGSRITKLQNDLSDTMRRINQLSEENDRLKRLIGREDAHPEGRKTDVSEAMALLKEESEESAGVAPVSTSELAQLAAEEKSEQSTGTSLLVQPADAKEKRAQAQQTADAEARQKAAEAAARHIDRPSTYVVQEGDTLYKLAVRYYGRSGAWLKIREANKAIISTDGRIRAGQKLVLPE